MNGKEYVKLTIRIKATDVANFLSEDSVRTVRVTVLFDISVQQKYC